MNIKELTRGDDSRANISMRCNHSPVRSEVNNEAGSYTLAAAGRFAVVREVLSRKLTTLRKLTARPTKWPWRGRACRVDCFPARSGLPLSIIHRPVIACLLDRLQRTPDSYISARLSTTRRTNFPRPRDETNRGERCAWRRGRQGKVACIALRILRCGQLQKRARSSLNP